jgi:hypothetical protein
MRLLQSMVIALVCAMAVPMIAQTAAAAGKGGKGNVAAVAIDTILLINPIFAGEDIRAEIAGGGFLAGEILELTLDGVVDLVVVESSETMLVTHIPVATPEGDHTIEVRVGDANKQSATAVIRLGGTMIVSCISWFRSGPADEHVHTEVHVEDQNREAVIGATVTWTAEHETIGVYQTNVSLTADNDGHAHGANCPVGGDGEPDVSGSGVTGWFCCIGAGKWDGETPPGKRACSEGEYTARIVNVTAPLFTNLVWDGVIVESSITLEDTRFP